MPKTPTKKETFDDLNDPFTDESGEEWDIPALPHAGINPKIFTAATLPRSKPSQSRAYKLAKLEANIAEKKLRARKKLPKLSRENRKKDDDTPKRRPGRPRKYAQEEPVPNFRLPGQQILIQMYVTRELYDEITSICNTQQISKPYVLGDLLSKGAAAFRANQVLTWPAISPELKKQPKILLAQNPQEQNKKIPAKKIHEYKPPKLGEE